MQLIFCTKFLLLFSFQYFPFNNYINKYDTILGILMAAYTGSIIGKSSKISFNLIIIALLMSDSEVEELE